MGDAAILRAQIGSSTDPDRLEREARMAEVSERKKLEEAIGQWRSGRANLGAGHFDTIVAAAEAHLATLPETKMVEVWAVWCSHTPSSHSGYVATAIAYLTKAQADEEARKSINDGNLGVHVTGPHRQEVPA